MNDYAWLTDMSKLFLERDYLLPLQTVDDRVDIICNTAEKKLGKPGFAARFKENVKKGWYSLSSPIWANLGTDRALPISCFGSHVCDSIASIAYAHAEVMMMTKHGGGTSAYFGDIRPRGSSITDNGESSGSVHFMQLFDLLINITSQGKVRRGNFAAYLPVDHKDIMEFLTIRSEGHPIQDLSFGVCVPDYWMEEMIAGSPEKRAVWAKILECRANIGYPYIFFVDNANKNTVDVYKDKNMKITHSNLCVTGNQRVVSDRGMKTAKELFDEGGTLSLFDNDKVVSASPMQLIEKDADVYEISLSNGMTHTVTGYHKLKVFKGDKSINVSCLHLCVGDKVAIQTKKGLFGKKTTPVMSARSVHERWAPPHSDEDFWLPIRPNIPGWVWEADEISQVNYLRDKLSTGTSELQDVQILMANLGMPVKIQDGKLVSCDDEYATIESIKYAGKEDVYCCKVDSEEHHWVCNGVVTHNCTEIMLPDDDKESFVCDLSSMNIMHYDDWKDTDAVELLVYFLDAVMTEFIEKASKIAFMERAVQFAEQHRALGVGWLGYHSYLQSKMIAFESMEAKLLNVQIAKNIFDKAYAASAKLAQEYGEPEVLKGYGRRNTTLMAIAPTKSSAFILGQVSEGVEPHRTNHYIKDLQKGKFTVKNAQLEQLLEEKGKNTDEVWSNILKNGGSVQHLSFLSEHEKNVFKTFAEISQKEIVIQAAARQKFIDQGQSLNLMIHPSVPIKDVNSLIIEAWRLGVKSLYYQVSVNAAQQFSRNILACASCES